MHVTLYHRLHLQQSHKIVINKSSCWYKWLFPYERVSGVPGNRRQPEAKGVKVDFTPCLLYIFCITFAVISHIQLTSSNNVWKELHISELTSSYKLCEMQGEIGVCTPCFGKDNENSATVLLFGQQTFSMPHQGAGPAAAWSAFSCELSYKDVGRRYGKKKGLDSSLRRG